MNLFWWCILALVTSWVSFSAGRGWYYLLFHSEHQPPELSEVLAKPLIMLLLLALTTGPIVYLYHNGLWWWSPWFMTISGYFYAPARQSLEAASKLGRQ